MYRISQCDWGPWKHRSIIWAPRGSNNNYAIKKKYINAGSLHSSVGAEACVARKRISKIQPAKSVGHGVFSVLLERKSEIIVVDNNIAGNADDTR